MGWITTKSGKRINTDWFDEDANQKERQINTNKKEAEHVSIEEREKERSTIEKFDIQKLGELEDADELQSFIKKNLHNPEFKQFGRDRGTEAVRQLWYETKRQQEIQNLHEMPIEDAISKVRESIDSGHSAGWFREANSEYKPHIATEMFTNKGTFNAALNIAYHNYKNEIELKNIRSHSDIKPLDYKTWLITPQTVYRGTSGQQLINSDVFTSYTPDKKVAEGFAFGTYGKAGSQHGGEGKISSMTIRPIDTWGQLNTTGELEFLIPLTIEQKSKVRR